MNKLEQISKLIGHRGRVWNISWHPKDDIIASCGEDKTIRLWSRSGNEWTNKAVLVGAHNRTIREVSWSPCGNFLASSSFDGTTAIWDKKIGQFECNATLEGHENEVKSVSWSPSGHFLATCGRDKSVWIWEVADNDEYECAAVLNSHDQDVKKVVWHPHLDILASCSYDDTIKLYKEDPSDSEWVSISVLKGHTSTVWSLAFDKDGARIASCSDDKTVKIWRLLGDINNSNDTNDVIWKCVCTLSGYHTRAIYDVTWCTKTGLIATACGDDLIRIFKELPDTTDPNEPIFELLYTCHDAHSQDVNAVKWNPRKEFELLSCGDDGEVKLWKFIENN